MTDLITIDLTPVPSRKSPDTFSGYMDTFLGKLPGWAEEANTLAEGCNTNALAAANSAFESAASALASANSASESFSSASDAEGWALTAQNAPGTSATSGTSLLIDVGSKSLTLSQTGKAFAIGQYVNIAKTSAPENAMFGKITDFDSGTGEMAVSVSVAYGSGTHADWTISLAQSVLPQATTDEMEAATETGLRSMSPADIKYAIERHGIPVGAVFIFPTGAVIDGFLEVDGSSLSIHTYSELNDFLDGCAGYADADHFYLPDYRGRFLRGWAHGQSTDPDRASRTDRGDGTTGDYVGTKQGSVYVSHTHGGAMANISIVNANNILGSSGPGYTYGSGTGSSVGFRNITLSQTEHTHPASGGNENRPVNINVMFCIKY